MVEIVDLASLPDRTSIEETLAEWHVAEWGHLYDPAVWNGEIALAELRSMGAGCTLVMLDGGELVGSVSLLATDDLPGWEGVGPWLASLFVTPGRRGEGIGATLTDACLALARDQGFDGVQLFTAAHEQWYLDRGWRTVGTADANGTAVAVMFRRTAGRAARRSVVSRWVTNADFGGAYSFLRAGGTPADRAALHGEVLPGLWLAGEHTSVDGPGTMHGAWASGAQAAASVLAAGHRSALVIGAGLAGLAAARRLTSAGVQTTVLEAGDGDRRSGSHGPVARLAGQPRRGVAARHGGAPAGRPRRLGRVVVGAHDGVRRRPRHARRCRPAHGSPRRTTPSSGRSTSRPTTTPPSDRCCAPRSPGSTSRPR